MNCRAICNCPAGTSPRPFPSIGRLSHFAPRCLPSVAGAANFISRTAMRRFQFWILVVGSSLVGLLMIKQIFLSRALNQEQSVLIGSEETAASAQTYETAWQKLAMSIFQ